MLLVNSLLGFFEDMKAKASVNALKAKMVNHVDTVRYGEDGRKTYVPLNPKFLVVGDTIHVRGGDAIPADCSFLEGSEISVSLPPSTVTSRTKPSQAKPNRTVHLSLGALSWLPLPPTFGHRTSSHATLPRRETYPPTTPLPLH